MLKIFSSACFLWFFLAKRWMRLSMHCISYSDFCRMFASLLPTWSASLCMFGSCFSMSSTSWLISFLKWLRVSLSNTRCFSYCRIFSIEGSSILLVFEPNASSLSLFLFGLWLECSLFEVSFSPFVLSQGLPFVLSLLFQESFSDTFMALRLLLSLSCIKAAKSAAVITLNLYAIF